MTRSWDAVTFAVMTGCGRDSPATATQKRDSVNVRRAAKARAEAICRAWGEATDDDTGHDVLMVLMAPMPPRPSTAARVQTRRDGRE